jgi:hypothetical protein
MICKTSCLIAIMFITGNIFFTLNIEKYSIIKDYLKVLNSDQITRYRKIVEERKQISLHGYLIGLVCSLCIILINYYYLKQKFNNISILCLTGATTFIIHYFYYILSPKSDWMLNHLTNTKQNKHWLKVYRTMQYTYHSGMLIGIASVMLLSYSFKC